MFECSKAVARRIHDPAFTRFYFVGDGIDIGCGPDPLAAYAELFPLMRSCRHWDIAEGDAQWMRGLADDTFDFVHSSHCLEHVEDPVIALDNWLRILKPGGHLVCLVPDEDLYEQGQWPSTYNADHKHTLTVWKASHQSWSPQSVNVVDLLKRSAVQIKQIKVLESSYRFRLPEGVERLDQTLTPIGESAIEFVVRKAPFGWHDDRR